MKYKSYLIIALLFISACNNQANIPEKQFAQIYFEIIQSKIKNSGNPDALKKERSLIYSKYSIDDKKFTKAIEYYTSNIENWQKITKEIDKIQKDKLK